MHTLTEPARHQVEIKKSRFIVHAAPVSTVDAALAYIATVAAADATHNCWAYRLDPVYRFSDDGEPAGTAGRPIYAAMERQQLDRLVVVVTRYFGGIKLGAGGLVRAYGGTAAACLQNARKISIQATTKLTIECDFAHSQRLHDLLARLGVDQINLEYTSQGLRLHLEIEERQHEALQSGARNACRGNVRIVRVNDAG